MSAFPLMPCCAPTKQRAVIFESSQSRSAERVRAASGSTGDMVRLDGRYLAGSEDGDAIAADGEGPVRPVIVDPFYIDAYPVTTERFAEFIHATDYKTEAERFGWSFVFAGHLENGGNAFEHPPGLAWWRKVALADWRHPEGPDSSLEGREHHPVTQISWNDGAAFAAWAGKRLPTEAEWEFACRGGLEQKRYPWGDELMPGGAHLCNIWQGEFPDRDLAEDGYAAPAPVKAYPANGFGLFMMTGNTWEWCADAFSVDHHLYASRVNPVGPEAGSTGGLIRVMRGGSYLCHASYCNRYRNAARTSNTPDSAATNIGFRCVRDVD